MNKRFTCEIPNEDSADQQFGAVPVELAKLGRLPAHIGQVVVKFQLAGLGVGGPHTDGRIGGTSGESQTVPFERNVLHSPVVSTRQDFEL